MKKEGRKKQARSYKQQGKATQHTQGSHFSKENELPRVGFEPTTLHTLDRALALPAEPRQLNWLGQNLTSHSTPDEQANYQLSMKEKAGVMTCTCTMYIPEAGSPGQRRDWVPQCWESSSR